MTTVGVVRLAYLAAERATEPIYHYTDAQGLLGLVEKGQIWATEAAGMNDLDEVRQGWRFIHEWLDNHYLGEFIGDLMRKAAQGGSSPTGTEGLFVACASTRADDSSQWAVYGRNGRGYSVEIDPSKPLAVTLRDAKRPPPEHAPDADFVSVTDWLHVLYSVEAKEAALEALWLAAQREIPGVFDSFEHVAGADPDEYIDNLEKELRSELAVLAQVMKADSFASEKEVRKLVHLKRDDCSLFRGNQNGVVRYVRLVSVPAVGAPEPFVYETELPRPNPLPIKSVLVGPILDFNTQRPSVAALLSSNGLDGIVENIYPSEAPLRH